MHFDEVWLIGSYGGSYAIFTVEVEPVRGQRVREPGGLEAQQMEPVW